MPLARVALLVFAGCMCDCRVLQAFSDGPDGLRSVLESMISGDTVLINLGVYRGARHCNATVRASGVWITGVGFPYVDCSGTGARHMSIEGSGVQVDGVGLDRKSVV